MSKNKTNSLAPLVASLGCLSVAATTSLISGSLTGGVLPIAGMLLNGLLGDLSINIASDQLLKVSPKKLRKTLISKSKNTSNHDLQKALKDALKTALIKCYELYEESSKKNHSQDHFTAIQRKISIVCGSIDDNFLLEIGEELKESEILDYDEGLDNRINRLLKEYLYEIEDFKNHGKEFLPLLESQLPLEITAAFTEELKDNPRCWIAYQRSLLQDLRSNDEVMKESLAQSHDKLDSVLASLEVLDLAGNSIDDKMLQVLIKGTSEINTLMNLSIERMEKYHEEFMYRINQLEERLMNEIRSQSDLLKLNHNLLKEVHSSIQSGDNKEEFDQLQERVLPRYLNYMVEEYRYISLPSIGGSSKNKSIPLDNIYVALQLADDQTSKDFHYASQFVRKQIINAELSAKRDLSAEEKLNIQAKVMQKNQTLRNFDYSELEKKSEKSISLAELFCQERYTVLLGDPGSGKSTIVKWLALQFAQQFNINSLDKRILVSSAQIYGSQADGKENAQIDLGNVRLPILIKIPEYAKFFDQEKSSEKGIIDYCGLHIPTIPGVSSDEIRQLISHYLSSNQAVVFLDGMDEVVKEREKILLEIRKFITYWVNLGKSVEEQESPEKIGGNQVLITSRIVGYHAAPLDEYIKEVYVRAMDDGAIKSFCRLWTKETGDFQDDTSLENASKELVEALFDKSKPRIRELATNPLLITILALLYHSQDKKLPRNRVELYERTISILMGKWTQLHSDINPATVEILIEEVAFYIHSSPSEIIAEKDLIEILELNLVSINPNSSSTERTRQANSFVRIIRQDVGLLSERGQKLYHFLHRTFQEFLAARKMIREPEKAISTILANLNDPVWREPVTMAVAYASSLWSDRKFSEFIDQLLNSEEGVSQLIPRGTLLLSSAIPDLGKINKELYSKIIDGFLVPLGDKQGLGQFSGVRDKIKNQLKNLRTNEYSEYFFQCCIDILDEKDYASRQWELINLACEEGWYKKQWLDNIYAHIDEDPADYGFPIDRYLQLLFSTQEESPNTSHLKLREQLIKRPELEQKLINDPLLLKLVSVLYGGWAANQKAPLFFELEKIRRAFLSKSVEMENKGYGYGVRLDTELGKVKEIKTIPVNFSIHNIHRDCYCTRMIIIGLELENSHEHFVSYFKNCIETEESLENKSIAILALAVLGLEIKEVIDVDNIKYAQVLTRFVQHIQRIRNNIRLPLFQFTKRANNSSFLRDNKWNLLNREEEELAFVSLMNACKLEDLIPPISLPGDLNNYIHEDELDSSSDVPELRSQRFADSLLSLTMPLDKDSTYTCATLLDTRGKHLSRHNSEHLLQGVLRISSSTLLDYSGNSRWAISKYFFPFTTTRNQYIDYLRICFGISKECSSLRDFLVHSIWGHLQEYPELIQLALCVFSTANSSYGRQKIQENLGFGNSVKLLIEATTGQKDPYIRFLMAYFLNENFKFLELQILMERTLAEIDSYQDFIVAYLLSSEINLHERLHFFNSVVSNFINEKVSPKGKIENEDYGGTILNKLKGKNDTLFIANALLYSIPLVKGTNKNGICEHAINMITLIDDENYRANFVKKIAPLLNDVSLNYFKNKQRQILDSFENQFLRNRSTDREFLNIFGLSQKYQTVSGLNLLGLSEFSKSYSTYFKDEDAVNPILINIVNGIAKSKEYRKLFYLGKDGIGITQSLINAVKFLVQKGDNEKLQALYPLMFLKSNSDIDLIQHWENHNLEGLRVLYQLLKGETKVLNIEVLESMITILRNYPDRMKRRARIVVHGPNPVISFNDREYRTSQLGYDYLIKHYELLLFYQMTDPLISNALSWSHENWIDDDPRILEQAVEEYKTASGFRKKSIRLFLSKISAAEKTTVDKLLELIRKEESELSSILWNSLGLTLYRYESTGITLDFNKSDLKTLVSHEIPSKSLNSLEKYSAKSNQLKHFTLALENTIFKEGDLTSQVNQLITEVESLAVIPFSEYVDDEDKLWTAFVNLGKRRYYWASDSKNLADNFIKKVKDDIPKLQILIKTTIVRLEDDLYKDKLDYIGSNASYLLGEWAVKRPEFVMNYFPNTTNVQRILAEVIEKYPFYIGRFSTIKIIRGTNIMSKSILKALVGAIKDIDYVKPEAIKTLNEYTDELDDKSFEMLKEILNGQSAEVTTSVIKMFGNISMNPSINSDIRISITDVLAAKLNTQKVKPEKNMFLYEYNHFTTPIKDAPFAKYRESIDDVLYTELIRLTVI